MVGSANGSKQKCGNRAALDATAGAIAGAVARLVVNPLDVLKIRFQVQLEPISAASASGSAASALSKYTGLRQAFVTIIKEEGIKVLLVLDMLTSDEMAPLQQRAVTLMIFQGLSRNRPSRLPCQLPCLFACGLLRC